MAKKKNIKDKKIDEVRKKYKYKDIKGKIIVEIEVFEKKDQKQDVLEEYDCTILEESEGIDGRAINESLELCEEIKETYKIYSDNAEIKDYGQLFKDINKAGEYHPWEKVLDELEAGTLLSGSSTDIPSSGDADAGSPDRRAMAGKRKKASVKALKKLFIQAWVTLKRKFNKIL